MNAAGEEGPEIRGAGPPGPELGALGEEIVRMATELRAREAELGRLRARYEELSKQGRS